MMTGKIYHIDDINGSCPNRHGLMDDAEKTKEGILFECKREYCGIQAMVNIIFNDSDGDIIDLVWKK